MGFKEMVAAANRKVFLNTDRYAEKRTVIYDGVTYKDIPAILTGIKEKDRRSVILQDGRRDNAKGLFMAISVLRCAISDLGGNKPEKGQLIKISSEKNGDFYHDFYVATSVCEHGMLRVELEAIDE
jgi:hypothetical protein